VTNASAKPLWLGRTAKEEEITADRGLTSTDELDLILGVAVQDLEVSLSSMPSGSWFNSCLPHHHQSPGVLTLAPVRVPRSDSSLAISSLLDNLKAACLLPLRGGSRCLRRDTTKRRAVSGYRQVWDRT
jgi:hypothetical protein